MKKTTFASTFILILLISTLSGTLFVKSTSANPDESLPNLAMPTEHINYTITNVNGALWAIIDGYYPIYVLEHPNCNLNYELPMVYPMPPQTTNIHVLLGDNELSWVNYTQSNPYALHHTAIGEWWMISAVLNNVSDFFKLKIHYEHPLEVVNGSCLFLYDLNISPYLSEKSNNSTAYFTIYMPTNTANLQAYTTETDNIWNHINYTKTNADMSTNLVSIQMNSEYGKPLPGDLVVVFSKADQAAEYPLIAIVIVSLFILLLFVIVIIKKNSQKKTATDTYLDASNI